MTSRPGSWIWWYRLEDLKFACILSFVRETVPKKPNLWSWVFIPVIGCLPSCAKPRVWSQHHLNRVCPLSQHWLLGAGESEVQAYSFSAINEFEEIPETYLKRTKQNKTPNGKTSLGPPLKGIKSSLGRTIGGHLHLHSTAHSADAQRPQLQLCTGRPMLAVEGVGVPGLESEVVVLVIRNA